jgi:hypothetical protein
MGCTLAIAGCGDDKGDSLDQALGDGGSSGSGGDFCQSLCEVCTNDQADCAQGCGEIIGGLPGELDGCPNQLNALTSCLDSTDCDEDICEPQVTAWITCIVGLQL